MDGRVLPGLHQRGLRLLDFEPATTAVVIKVNSGECRGQAVLPTSSENFLTQEASPTVAPVSYTLGFPKPVRQVVAAMRAIGRNRQRRDRSGLDRHSARCGWQSDRLGRREPAAQLLQYPSQVGAAGRARRAIDRGRPDPVRLLAGRSTVRLIGGGANPGNTALEIGVDDVPGADRIYWIGNWSAR